VSHATAARGCSGAGASEFRMSVSLWWFPMVESHAYALSASKKGFI
jgi:hypothetical protein